MDALKRAAPLVLLAAIAPVALAGTGVVSTRHNLSRSSPGEVRASTETEVCVFCHASHVESGAGPLWNRSTSGAVTYQPYDSPTLSSRPGQPEGSTLLCLSCHDGTVALGAVGNRDREIDMIGTGLGRIDTRSPGNLGTDLAGTHPVSMSYDEGRARDLTTGARTRLKPEPAPTGGGTLLDAARRVQCTACHDAHEDPAATGANVPPFWRGGSFDDVCTACHDAPVEDAGHARAELMPQGCGSCHVGHGAERQPMLEAVEEDACYACHGSNAQLERTRQQGRVARRSAPAAVEAAFQLPYRHPIDETSRLHEAGEEANGARVVARHVECVDCHPIHGSATMAQSSLMRARGRASGGIVGGQPEYELCYTCHGTTPDLPYGATDKTSEFSPSNESFHPVEASLGKRSVPSLLSPWVSGDRMTCGDCHGADEDDAPAGPHGSRNAWILKDRYEATDGKPESAAIYAACYSCHSRTSILGDESFAGHSLHVVVAKESCYACHDSHGAPDAPGLVRFGKDFRYGSVLPSSSGRLEYDPTNGGACYLTCHGVDHDPLGYR